MSSFLKKKTFVDLLIVDSAYGYSCQLLRNKYSCNLNWDIYARGYGVGIHKKWQVYKITYLFAEKTALERFMCSKY